MTAYREENLGENFNWGALSLCVPRLLLKTHWVRTSEGRDLSPSHPMGFEKETGEGGREGHNESRKCNWDFVQEVNVTTFSSFCNNLFFCQWPNLNSISLIPGVLSLLASTSKPIGGRNQEERTRRIKEMQLTFSQWISSVFILHRSYARTIGEAWHNYILFSTESIIFMTPDLLLLGVNFTLSI